MVVTNFIPTGRVSGGESIAISRDGAFIYLGITNAGGFVTVLDTQSLKIVGHLLSGAPLVVY